VNEIIGTCHEKVVELELAIGYSLPVIDKLKGVGLWRVVVAFLLASLIQCTMVKGMYTGPFLLSLWCGPDLDDAICTA
jgi:hypothetical protein